MSAYKLYAGVDFWELVSGAQELSWDLKVVASAHITQQKHAKINTPPGLREAELHVDKMESWIRNLVLLAVRLERQLHKERNYHIISQ